MAERPLWAPKELDTPELMLAEARKAFFVMFGFMVVIWALQILNWIDHQDLSLQYGIRPWDVGRLPDVFAAPFLHFSWAHIESNSGPLFVFGFLAAYRGVVRFLWLTLLVTLTSGMAVWFFQGTDTVGVGASGVIFGYFGYVVLRGVFDRHLIDTLIGLVMAASFAYLVTIAVPGTPGVSWLAHLGGLVGGMAGAWLLRDRRPRALAAPGPATAAAPAGGGVPAVPGERSDLHKELGDLGLL
ncbi:rhomboid family intramembrane serine protease [Streptacidiphilus jiangxiensis]|uniref:Membrane associated serine protease, rhomboid family n=2 Tax=Streptacidiphilus jiangxiensis TaxID=235985 RepID=A0A1H7LZ78_STRJI|nr:rhomboid family intramembrane serine protease [Streptacidiphilus jiangxiensis]SEL04231.1 Membrane associated serine protease, rhomboid family [Streptacidiphilus jiangxiensis]